MTVRPVIEHIDVLEDILPCGVTSHVGPMVHELTLECSEEAFDSGVVAAVAVATHTGDEAVLVKYPLIARGGIRTAAIRVVQEPGPGSPVRQRHGEACSVRSTVSRRPIAQPLTRWEYSSSTTAR